MPAVWSLIVSKHFDFKRFGKQYVQSEYVAAHQAMPARLQESIPDEVPPPRPQLLAALKKGFLTYEEKRNRLLSEEDSEAVTSEHADVARAASCSDKHELCPFWASRVRIRLICYHVRLYQASYLQHACLGIKPLTVIS